jgi:hypothetical protein
MFEAGFEAQVQVCFEPQASESPHHTFGVIQY